MSDFWIVLTGSLVAVNCAILGVFLILRKMAMVGDAISHAVLPGIVIAFLIANSRNSLFMLIGAAAFGVLTTLLIELFYKKARLQSDASIGVTFTWLFAIGVILVTAFSGNVDLDQECVLYGDIAYVPFDGWILGSTNLGPTAIWLQGGNFLVLILGLIIGYRGLFITSFDEAFSIGLGINAGAWHYALMAAVSLTVVLSFNSVGAILVVAFIVVPPAAAYLLSKRLGAMLWISGAIGIISAISGYYLADLWKASISASMAVSAGIIFAFVFAFTLIKRRLFQKTEESKLIESWQETLKLKKTI